MPIRQLDRSDIKREAQELIHTASVSPIKFTLLFLAISLVLDLLDAAATSFTGSIFSFALLSVSFLSILITLVTHVLDAGYYCYCLGVHRREEMPYESLFDGFTFAGKVIALTIVEAVFIALWSLLLVVPGIIAVYRYSFAMWNLCADPSIGVMEALNRSKRQTVGYKWQLFSLQISFIGWYFLLFLVATALGELADFILPGVSTGAMLFSSLLISVGTGAVSLYLRPYMTLSVCGFYRRATAPFDPMGGRDWRSGPEF